MKKLLALFLILFGTATLLWAATATVVPTSDVTTDAWVTTPLFSKINEDIDTPNDTPAKRITSPTNPTTPTNDIVFGVTCPADLGTITEANLRVRAILNLAEGAITLTSSWSATATTTFNAVLTGAWANYASGNQTGLSISKATCDASTLKIAPTTTTAGDGAVVSTYNLDIVYTTPSGRRKSTTIF